jgi:hypothetical protein
VKPGALQVLSLALLAASCAAPPSVVGRTPLLPMSAKVAEGTWALTDDRNDTFNVILRGDGSATSTWSRGTDGARGEQGGWSLRDGEVVVQWTDGWIDILRLGRYGYEKVSYAPQDRERDLPNSFGQAVKLSTDTMWWVGVWRTTSVYDRTGGEELFVCLSSDGSAVKSIDAINTGCWQMQADGAAIHWSDGWYTLLRREGSSVKGRSWKPGADHDGEPTGSDIWQEVTE